MYTLNQREKKLMSGMDCVRRVNKQLAADTRVLFSREGWEAFIHMLAWPIGSIVYLIGWITLTIYGMNSSGLTPEANPIAGGTIITVSLFTMIALYIYVLLICDECTSDNGESE